MDTGILDILNSIISNYKKIDIKELPTQGFFYKEDFSIMIKKASYEDILEYNSNYVKNRTDISNIGIILYEAYKIVRKNTKFSIDYSFVDIKSNDIIYIFFEIVKYTMNKDILVSVLNLENVVFNNTTFNYFDYNLLEFDYDSKERLFLNNGYKISIPSIGVQNCLVEYVYSKNINDSKLNYDFLFFLGDKVYLSEDEIDNLITIFNYELDDKELKTIRNIVYKMTAAIPNTLKINDNVVSIDITVDFENLFL